MPKIVVKIDIRADINTVFDLARNIDAHKISTAQTNEEAIAGRTSGLIELGESVTWRAKHFGVYQNLTSEITEFKAPTFFVDEMVSGAFKSFRHEHHFEQENDITTVTDIFDYASPFGLLGRLVDHLFLENYMRTLLESRNRVIKEIAEKG